MSEEQKQKIADTEHMMIMCQKNISHFTNQLMKYCLNLKELLKEVEQDLLDKELLNE